MNLPKLLIFIDWYLPAYKAGGPISSVRNFAEALKTHYDIYIITGSVDIDGSSIKIDKLNKWTEVNGIQVYYCSEDNINKARFKSLIEEVNPSFVYLQSLFSAKFTLLPLRVLKSVKKPIKTVIAPRGMFGKNALSGKAFKKKVFLRMAKTLGWFKQVTWHATNEDEKNSILEHMPKGKVHIAANFGYFADNFSPKQLVGDVIQLLSVTRIVSIKNIHFFLEVLKNVEHSVKYTIVGPTEEEDYLITLKEIVKDLPDNVSVDFTGGKSYNELHEFYESADLFISSSLNENYGHTIAEALSYGIPCLVSANTPWNQLEENGAGKHLKLDTELWKKELNTILSNLKSYSKEQIRAYAKSEILDDGLIERYRELFGRLS